MVYIDNFDRQYGRMKMSHMVADSTDELVSMAKRIGVNPKWIQHAGTNLEHFDVCLSMKEKAISFGTVLINMRVLAMATGKRKGPNEKLEINSVTPPTEDKQ